MIFFHLSTTWLSDLYIAQQQLKNGSLIFFNHLTMQRQNEARLLIKSGYYIVPSPSTVLLNIRLIHMQSVHYCLLFSWSIVLRLLNSLWNIGNISTIEAIAFFLGSLSWSRVTFKFYLAYQFPFLPSYYIFLLML